jgi:hypothetical protein
MKSESLVIADQQCCGEYVPGPCTQLKAQGSVRDEVVRIHSCVHRTQRRERQDESGNGPSEGPETNNSPNPKGCGEPCVYHGEVVSSHSRNPLGMLEIASYVTPGDPAVVREPESHCRKSAES